MKNTVEQTLTARPLEEKDVLPFVNYELLPFLQQVRTAHNQVFSKVFTLTTPGTGVFTPIYAEMPPPGRMWLVSAFVFGRRQDGAGHISKYMIALFSCEAAGAAQVGATSVMSLISDFAAAAQFAVTGGQVQLQIQDDAAGVAVDWGAYVQIREAPKPA